MNPCDKNECVKAILKLMFPRSFMLCDVWPLRLCCSVQPSQQTGTSLQKDASRLLSTVAVTILYDRFLFSYCHWLCVHIIYVHACVYMCMHMEKGVYHSPHHIL